MPRPYIFRTREELITRLKAKDTNEAVGRFFAERSGSICEVVLCGVASNTFRAFRNMPQPPSKIFRTWASQHLENTLRELQDVINRNGDDTSREGYASYVHDATKSLQSYWRKHMEQSEIGYGRSAKLFNLLLKKLACLNQWNEQSRKKLIQLLHIPLDSYTIVGLKNIAKELEIPRNATMNHITNQSGYEKFQRLISQITAEARVAPIYYEVLAWDMGHSSR